ncbi:E3 ubiquitin-protein ligase UBR2 isoform X2 [Xenopus tropicalis]|uniref:E3 ubiquitin-protein ligase n=1 Tax=Xenopus tropicalis TaxID=8364 RepID=A0A8J1JLL1_XENTR|nr:E3 ubiquitin-protein ligase UBR2 isoform X2 [Xenopus tropicalis]
MAAPEQEAEVPGIDSELLACCAGEVALKWLQATDLPKEVYQHLAYYVPKIYCQGSNPTPENEDMVVQHVLLGPMEWYLCGEDPAIGFPKLKQANKPSQLCGRVFKVGEPTYSCRDCAVDPTCVLCMECFLGSVHREHRYRMTTSGGGGFCDCGDAEAWKGGPYCQKHALNISESETEDPLIHLSEDMIARAYNMFAIMFRYAVDILTWEKENELPDGLECVKKDDTYYCMLFNDEVHTYEQVIYTLQKAVSCSQKEAISFATTVDRDGRRSVRNGDFQSCEQAKSVIVRNTSRQTKPLKVQVMHSAIVAHQTFGLKLISWLGQVIGSSGGLRRILCQVGLQEGPEGENSSLVDRLMLCDSKLWKGARNCYHQLFMSSLLMDLKYKKLFAIRFAKNYQQLQRDFMEDDHDRAVSVAALSVQLFTVPTLARMLITEENMMATVIKTFMDHLRTRDIQGRFQFERYTALQAFKFRRVQSLIMDLKYVLISKPFEWTDGLRCKFLEGFEAFLELLKCMQGMDPITRQVGQHIEMEPEWEAAFTLQMKLTHIISMIQDWCSCDEHVLIEAYKKCLIVLMQCHSGFTDGEQPITLSISGHSVETIRYCVSQEKVSIHLPVSRLLAGLHALLSKSEVAYKFPEQLPFSELSPPMLIEHPLRSLVLCAQVHAGMWRRNGFSLVNQIYYYHNVKCRKEMFDKDIVMLQAGASMMDPNHFLMIVLSRFELYQIFSTPDYGKRFRKEHTNKDIIQQNNTLIEEMLHLIIMIVGERFCPGVGQVSGTDVIKREIIHQLSIKPMAHSELVKALPEDENKETGMETVIETIASFKKPGLTGRGLYELKPECTKDFNLFYFHFSRAEQSKAEEAQRKLKRQIGEDTALPPPVLPPFCPLFASLINILQSDVMLCIMGTVLQWAVEPNGYAWSESMLQRVLHLIGMALQEEHQHLQNISEDNIVTFNFTEKISRPGEVPNASPSILAMLETLQNAAHLEVHKDMIRWILKMVSNIKKIRENPSTSPVVETEGSVLEENTRDKDKAERKRKAEIARLRREKIMAQMSEMQRHFIDENRELFQQTTDELNASTSTAYDHSCHAMMDTKLVALGPHQTRISEPRQLVTCILCQEEQAFTVDNKAMVLAAFIQRSTVFSKNRSRVITDPEKYDPLCMHPDLACGTHTGSCGHIMHAHCWQRYFDAVQAKEQRRQQRLRVHTSYDVENGEFLCPLCECLSNTVIPMLPPPRSLYHRLDFSDQPDLAEWVSTTSQQLKALCALHAEKSSSGEFRKEEPNTNITKIKGLIFVNSFSLLSAAGSDSEMPAQVDIPEGFRPDFQPKNPYSESIREMLTTFGTATYKVGLNVHPNEQDPRVPIMCWGSCAYTIQTIERILADEERPLFGNLPCRQDDCLKSLSRFAAAHWTVCPLPVMEKHFSRLFETIVPNEDAENSPCILDIDMFHLLVSLVVSFPALQCQDFSGNSLATGDLHLFHLVTMAHIVQIVLSCSTEENGMEQESTDGEEEQAAMSLYRTICRCSGSTMKELSSGWHLCRAIKTSILPYLRCAALFFHYLNGVPAPSEFLVSGMSQFDCLCSYLSLPTNLVCLFQENSKVMETLINRWCKHAEVKRFLNGECTAVSYPRESNKLIDLPEDYSSLINQASNFTCPKSGGDKSRAPTLCLVCGTMLCSQSYCCQTELDGDDVGACTAHTYTCGSGMGIFLRVRECQVLFLAGKTKGCFYAPPYLDDYGETDQGLRRGNPLHLCKERYKKIQKLWQQHSITEEIGHAQEANQTLTGIEWQHL